MLPVLYAMYRVIGTGHWAYLAGALFFGLGALAVVAHALTVPTAVTGTVLAIVGTLACLAVPSLTAHLGRFDMATGDVESQRPGAVLDSPFTARGGDPQREAGPAPPAADDVWARVRSATLTRSALYCGLALTAATAAAAVLHDQAPAAWSGLAFAAACACVLGLYVRRPRTIVERASLGIPATALVFVACAQAQDGANPMPLVAFGVVLATAVAAAVIGMRTTSRPRRLTTALPYLEYLASAALIPLALWVAGGYARLGIS
jgi:hypothetical protein